MIRAEVVVELDGREVYKGESKSFVQNFGKILFAILNGTGGVPTGYTGSVSSAVVQKLDGYTATVHGEYYITAGRGAGGGTAMGFKAGAGEDSWGILVGSGSDPVSPTQYNLSAKIPHGTDPGKLYYDVHTITSSYSDTSSYVEISRSFINKSSSPVTVREVGLFTRNRYQNVSGIEVDVIFMVARDVLPNPVTVNPLGSLLVRYRVILTT
jgi:hypothetical protein